MPNDLTPTASPTPVAALDPTAAVPLERGSDEPVAARGTTRETTTETTAEATTLPTAMRDALARSGGVVGILLAAAPAAAFVVADALGGLGWAFVALAVAAPVTFGVQLARREPLRGALVGLAVAGVCAGLAAFSGEARAFFLIPTLLPAVLGVLFLGSALLRRPVTGSLFNRLVGGPADWRSHARLLRVYTVTTLAGAVLHALNLAGRGVAYVADQPAVLAVLGVAAVPAFAALAAVTVVAARRAVSRTA